MIKVLAIDDEPLALQQLVAYIKKIPFLQLAGECQSALEARQIMDEEPIDALFCDINMPDLNGMDFIKSLAVPPLVVFTTAYSEYAVEGFKVNAVDYLLKPFGLQEFQRAVNRIRERLEVRGERLEVRTESVEFPTGLQTGSKPSADSRAVANSKLSTLNSQLPSKAVANSTLSTLNSQLPEDDTIFIKTDYKVVKIAISDIRYVEGMSEYLKIHLQSQPKPIVTLLSMKKMEEYLPPYFMRIHRSYIINLKMIQEVNKNRVIMDADTYLPIGDNYKEAFNEYLNAKFLGK